MNHLFGLGEEEKLGEAERLAMLQISRDKMAARRDRRTVRSECAQCTHAHILICQSVKTGQSVLWHIRTSKNKLRKVAGIDDFSTLSQYLYLK